MTQLAGRADEPWPEADVLLTDGDWTIEKLRLDPSHSGYRSTRSRFYSLLKHVCYPKTSSKHGMWQGGDGEKHRGGSGSVYQVVVYADDSSHCWRCTKAIPDGMVAVWKFQNWEVLQYGG